MLNNEELLKRRIINVAQSVLIVGGMALILSWSAELIFGEGVWIGVFAGIAISMLTLPQAPSEWVMRVNQAYPLSSYQFPELYNMARELSRRAGLQTVPRLYHVPSAAMNAFTVGNRDEAAIAFSDGMLRQLNMRELEGVMAHEISHLMNNDILTMRIVELVSRLTGALAWFGLIITFISLPLALFGLLSISFFGVLLLLLAPTINSLLQLTFSRTREFAADMDAARLTHDPEGLAIALYKLETVNRGFMQRLLRPGLEALVPAILRTHPITEERISRLMALKSDARMQRMYYEPRHHHGVIFR